MTEAETINAPPLGAYGRAGIGGIPWCDHAPERDAGGPVVSAESLASFKKPTLPDPAPSPVPPAPPIVPAPMPPIVKLWLAFTRAQRAYEAAIVIATECHDAAVTEAAQHYAQLVRHHAPALSLEAAERVTEVARRSPVEAVPEAEALAVARAAYVAAFRTAAR